MATNMRLIAAIFKVGAGPASEARILTNARALAEAVKPVFGEKAADQLYGILKWSLWRHQELYADQYSVIGTDRTAAAEKVARERIE